MSMNSVYGHASESWRDFDHDGDWPRCEECGDEICEDADAILARLRFCSIDCREEWQAGKEEDANEI